MTDFVEVIDLSSNNVNDISKIDLRKARARGARGVYLRFSLGLWADPDAQGLYDKAGEADLVPGGYFVPLPWLNAEQQVDYYLEQQHKLKLKLPHAQDCEVYKRSGKAVDPKIITATIQKVCLYLEKLQMHQAIYTSAGFWFANVLPWSCWRDYDLWVANYTSASKPLLPRDWNSWCLWQWSADHPPNMLGRDYGVQSTCIDLNRAVPGWFAKWAAPPEPEPDEPPADALKRLWNYATKQGWEV